MARLLIGTRKGLFTVERGADWAITSASFLGDPVTLAIADPRDGAVYAALDHGHFGVKLHRRGEGALEFSEIAAPAYPPKPDEVVDRDVSGREVPWSVKTVWSLTPGLGPESGELWCGTIPGGLFRSMDRGESWQLNEALWNHPLRKEWFGGGADYPGIHSVLLDPRAPSRITVGVSCGGVWVSEDSGASWSCRAEGMRAAYVPPDRASEPHIQDPHCVVHCQSDPDILWAQHHNGIFRSTDACASWSEIVDVVPSTFGFAVAVHPSDGDTAWFVPAIKDEKRIPVDGRLVVTRTRDGGNSFEVLTSGLPQDHAYDLVYRHALDVDGTGDVLAFGSTTGSLWVSEDQGDHWTCVTSHLPPIYSVRFG